LGEAAHVRLIDDGICHGVAKGLVAFPVVARGVNGDRSHQLAHVVFWRAGATAVPEGIGLASGVGIDENFVAIESLGGGIRGAIDAVSVVGTGLQASHEGVPNMKGLIQVRIEANGLEWVQRVVNSE
jgi:hypothetical protein